MTPIDRAAQAVREELGDYAVDEDTWMTEGGCRSSDHYRGIVRAVLKAIREPSDEMMEKVMPRPSYYPAEGVNEIKDTIIRKDREDRKRHWKAMIDAALVPDQ